MVLTNMRLPGRRRRHDPDLLQVEPGAVFRRVRSNNLVETARVLAITTDNVGIPHVRIEISVAGPHYARVAQGQRLLSLAAFVADFTEQVAGRRESADPRDA